MAMLTGYSSSLEHQLQQLNWQVADKAAFISAVTNTFCLFQEKIILLAPLLMRAAWKDLPFNKDIKIDSER